MFNGRNEQGIGPLTSKTSKGWGIGYRAAAVQCLSASGDDLSWPLKASRCNTHIAQAKTDGRSCREARRWCCKRRRAMVWRLILSSLQKDYLAASAVHVGRGLDYQCSRGGGGRHPALKVGDAFPLFNSGRGNPGSGKSKGKIHYSSENRPTKKPIRPRQWLARGRWSSLCLMPSKPSRYAGKHCRSRLYVPEFDEPPGTNVTSLFPHFIDARQSAMRGLDIGWYAMDEDGEIASGPFRGRNECAISITQVSERRPCFVGSALDARTTWRTSCRDQNRSARWRDRT